MGPFLCRIFLGREGDWTFQPRHLIFVLFFFLILSEWVLLSIALPDFQWKHCTPSLSLKSSMWEECKTWIPPPPLYTHIFFLWWRVVLWTEPFPASFFVCLFSKTQQSKWNCSVSTLSSIACLPCITYNAHLLIVSSCVLGEESRHLVSM